MRCGSWHSFECSCKHRRRWRKSAIVLYRYTCIYQEAGRRKRRCAIHITGIGELFKKCFYFFQTGSRTIAQVYIILLGIHLSRPVGTVLLLKIDGIINIALFAEIHAAVNAGANRKAIALAGDTGIHFITGIIKTVFQNYIHYTGNGIGTILGRSAVAQVSPLV